jgi:hypothetical protein
MKALEYSMIAGMLPYPTYSRILLEADLPEGGRERLFMAPNRRPNAILNGRYLRFGASMVPGRSFLAS